MRGLRHELTQTSDENDLERNDVLVVSDLKMLRLISDPVRIQLLELMRGTQRTVKELAAELGVPATRLYYHMNLLEEHGLIRVASTRLVSGIVEKRYEVTAARLSVDRSLLSPGGEPATGLDTQLAFVLDEPKTEIRNAYRAGLIDPSHEDVADGGLLLGRIWLRLSPAQVGEFQRQLDEVFEEYKATSSTDGIPNRQLYEFLVALYPTTSRIAEPDSAGE